MSAPIPPENPHALPPNFVIILFAALAGGLGPGIFMTLIGTPGTRSSPIFGLLLPWTVAPFLLAVRAGWSARKQPISRILAVLTTLAASGGFMTYLYGLLLDPNGAQNTQLFFWVPTVQLLMILRVAVRAFRDAKPD